MRLLKLLLSLFVIQSLGCILHAEKLSTIPEKDRQLAAAISQEFKLDSASTDVEVLRSSIPAGALNSQAHVRFESYNRDPKGLVSMTAYISNQTAGNIPYSIQLRIRTFSEALVATAEIKQHSAIDLAIFEKKRIETTLLTDPIWTTTEDPANFRTIRSILPGTPLTKRMVEPIPLIDAGNLVSIVIETPAIKIATVGTALDAGRRGDRIRVRNQSSGKVLTAVIRDERDVVITE